MLDQIGHSEHKEGEALSDAHESSVMEQHLCSDSEPLQAVVAAVLRPSAPHQIAMPITYAIATQPVVGDTCALTNCRGYDVPAGHILRSQFFPSSLFGRAPPTSV